MRKTLVLILNHNTSDLTSNLFNSLYPFEKNDYEIFVLDNGSDSYELNNLKNLLINNKKIINLSTNELFGGGLFYAFEMMRINSIIYDSLLFLNSDLIVHPYNFVKTLRFNLQNEDLEIISPCILQPFPIQNNWKQMHCWNNDKVRRVDWIDLQAPMFSEIFVMNKAIVPEKLKYGWGLDILYGMLTDKIGVLDSVPAIHLDSQTVRRCSNDPIISDYWSVAEKNMYEYFQSNYSQFLEFRNYGKNYQ